jgi:hypothetical protein
MPLTVVENQAAAVNDLEEIYREIRHLYRLRVQVACESRLKLT